MARKLKTYVTSIGFFEEAIAASSMKAALEAWGSSSNLFREGFAKETNDPAIIAATMKQPGVVLKRPVGSAGMFKIQAELPKNFIHKQITEAATRHETMHAKPYSAKVDKKTRERDRKAAEAYKLEKKHQEQQRQKQQALHRKLEKKREAAETRLKLALKKAENKHDRRLQALQKQQSAINNKIEAEEKNWNNEKKQLKTNMDNLTSET